MAVCTTNLGLRHVDLDPYNPESVRQLMQAVNRLTDIVNQFVDGKPVVDEDRQIIVNDDGDIVRTPIPIMQVLDVVDDDRRENPPWPAVWIEFSVNNASGFTTTDPEVSVDGVTYHNGVQPVVPVAKVYNPSAISGYMFAGRDNGKGIASWSWSANYPFYKYYITSMGSDHQARWIKCLINNGAGYATTDAAWTVDGVVYYDGYASPTAVTTVYNAPASTNYIFEGDDDDIFYAKYDPTNNKYWLYQGECP